MGRYVIGLEELDRTQVAVAGGKGALLGELSRIQGIRVPAGFCVTTDAFRRIMAAAPMMEDRVARLSGLEAHDHETARVLGAEVRQALERTVIPDDVAEAIRRRLTLLGDRAAVAVRSSATAEDLPSASFAGQQASYLNIVGPTAIVEHVRRCWASLFSERAIAYRSRNGVDHRDVQMAVVVQRMIVARAAGVLFTADPVTSNRKVASVEATLGLGEPLLSGRVNADVYQVRDGEVIARAVAAKDVAVDAAPAGGTEPRSIDPQQREQPALSDTQVVELVRLGRRIEAHLGHPQDVEWCLADDGFHVVQARPITTLFPVPETSDQDNHVYISVGHQQMMTDPMKALGLSLWRLTSPAPMVEVGGRLFVDATPRLASPTGRAALLAGFERSDPLTGHALRTVVERDDFVPTRPDEEPDGAPFVGTSPPIEADPAIVTELIARWRSSHDEAACDIATKSGPELLDFILADIQELQQLLVDPRSHQVIMAGMEATWWLNDQLQSWLGEKNAADTLTQSAPDNVTSQMGLALLDVADAIRAHPDVVAFLRHVDDEEDAAFLEDLADVPGGHEAQAAIRGFLAEYGMRCVGEIDITRPRWSERPARLVPMILGNIRNFEPGAAERRFERGRQQARDREQELLARLRALPDGERKAEETSRMIDRVRTFVGYREYPKYAMVRRYFLYKQALWEEAEQLVEAHVLGERDDIFHLTLQELRDVVRTHQVDEELIRRRKDAFASYDLLTPPRVLTSDGEVVTGQYRRDAVPFDALAGLPVSAGTAEGRARVVFDVGEADLDVGDILVTTSTDPSWTPAFVAIGGLVTEVGGLMTHGAVIAREYGLPAVVGVEHGTRRIRDGQWIRVNGTDGYVEVLSEPTARGVAERHLDL